MFFGTPYNQWGLIKYSNATSIQYSLVETKKKFEKKKVPKNAISAHLWVTDDQQPIPAAWVMTDDLPLGDAGSRGDD